MVRYNAHHNTTIVLTAVLCPLSLLAVALRLVARTKVKAGIGIDDVLAIAATITFFAFCFTFVLNVENGLAGNDLSMLPFETLQTMLKANYASSILALTALFLADLSILMLYRRTFRTHKKLQIAVYIVGAMCTAWWIGVLLGVAFRCLPVESYWNPLVTGKCYSLQKANIVMGVLNSLLDIAIVTMPIGVIKDLHLPPKQKLILCFMFLLGGLVAIINIIRITIYYKITSIDFRLDSGYWLEAQISAAILCICLPTLRPLIPKESAPEEWFKRFYSQRRRGRRFTDKKWKWALDPSGSNKQHQRNDTDRALSEDGSDQAVLTRVYLGADSREPGGLNNYPMNAISVRQEIDVV